VTAGPSLDELAVDTIRTLAMDAVEQAASGHPGTPMALAPVAYVLYREVLDANPANPAWPDRDRFVLSAGHACMLQYAALHLTGYDLPLEEIRRFRQWGSLAPGHPENHVTPGVETTTGPLGQGLSNAVGMAMAERFLAERYNRPGHTVVDHRVYAIASDGDLMEGVSSEACSLAGAFGLGKLIAIYDDNRITIDGTTALSFDHEDTAQRFEAYGWHVEHVGDANDIASLRAALERSRAETARPSLVIVRSHIAFPAPTAQDTSKAHGAPLGEAEVRATKEVLGWDPDVTFHVPDEVYAHLSLREKGELLEADWRDRFERWRAAFPALADEWDRAWAGVAAPGWEDSLPSFDPVEKPKLATRGAGAAVMHALEAFVPTMVGGSADLAESTKTELPGGDLFGRGRSGRNVPFGVREHAMGAIVNGLALHGGIVKPYGSTFLVFSDYMRPAVRLSALMRLPVVWVWTHDSIALGEDGPTHQPVEHLASLRAIPNLWVIRPADANETVVAWQLALEREDGPVALVLTRQDVPVLAPEAVARARRGGYVLWEPDDLDGSPDLLLLATGSEVWPTLEAARMLEREGVRARVVSLPCLELFAAQPEEYRASVLAPDVGARLAVEAGTSFGWERWVGDRGDVVSVDRFGASAPGAVLLDRFGLSPEAIAERARTLLRGRPPVTRPDRDGVVVHT
jgi:transketolase